ncbi:putative penicillin-binding [Diplodia seriata]|uniref:Putative penicillin-binding n=1 Tax=Diplodia seriata TaxID=420778 RepID=A0A0G2G378_9PEZI|nr:putative penicillin-binding [Diplodia seriata]
MPRLFGQQQHQQSQQQYQQQQEPVFETDGQRAGDYERVDQEADGEDDGWDEWVKEKYVVRDPFDEEFDRMVEETLEHWHVPGLSVAVGYGKAILPDVDATPDTLYYVGSTTKSFTAAAILILIEESQHQSGTTSSANLPPDLSLTTPVSSLIRADFVLPSTYTTRTATLEDLLTHRTGMPRHDLSYAASPNTTLAAHVRNLRHLPLTAAPRTTWQYCNMMYTALAHVLETLTSTTWAEFVTARIWTPLGMTAGTFASLAEAKQHASDRLSAPYFWDNATAQFVREPYVPDAPALVGAGNVLSCVSDYARYLRALLKRRPNFFPGPQGFRELRRAARTVVSDPADAGEEEARGGRNAPWSGPELHLHADIMDKLWSYQMCLEHVSGEYFMAWLGATKEFPNALFDDDMPLKARFDVGVSGKVERLHLAMEPKMGEDMIVFKRVDE